MSIAAALRHIKLEAGAAGVMASKALVRCHEIVQRVSFRPRPDIVVCGRGKGLDMREFGYVDAFKAQRFPEALRAVFRCRRRQCRHGYGLRDSLVRSDFR